MIPPFNELGFLPSGIHPANLSEIAARFGIGSELRRVQMDSIRWMVDLAVRAGIKRIVLNGSFVTDIIEPNDVDCVLLVLGRSSNQSAEDELSQGLPFLDISMVGATDFDYFVNRFFAFDRSRRPKGVIEVLP